ncbi:MAG: response regulator [Myxococcota bacterium]
MNRKYLVIDDNEEFAENVAEILSDTGADVSLAAEGAAALEQVRQQRFDVVVTDMRMPGMSGAELLKHMRDIDPGVPVVLVSAYAPDAQVNEARQYGLLAFLNKPSGTRRLLELLSHARRDATVLLVEDDRALAENLTEALADKGFTVCSASSMGELEKVHVRPLAALVDLRIPGSADGAVLDEVLARYPGTPVMVVTALNVDPRAGVELIRKPFDTRELVARLEALVGECAT